MKIVLIALTFFFSTFAFSAPSQQEKDFKAAVAIYSEIMGLEAAPDVKIRNFYSNCAAAAEKSFFVLGGLNCVEQLSYHAIHFLAAHEVAHIVHKDASAVESYIVKNEKSFLGKIGFNFLMNWKQLQEKHRGDQKFLELEQLAEINADLLAAKALDKFGINSCKGAYDFFQKFGQAGSDIHASGNLRVKYVCGLHLTKDQLSAKKDLW